MNGIHNDAPPLDSRQIRAFVALVRTGSFTDAARQLCLSQSAVSHAIRALEEDTRCRLLDRMGKKFALTPSGEQLFAHAEKILREMEMARQSLADVGKWRSGRLRLAASATACQYILPTVLREFQKEYPRHAISIESGDTPEVLELLRANRIDLAIGLEPQGDQGVDFYPLFTDDLSFIVAPSHPWAIAGAVVRDEIPQQKYILYSKSSLTFRVVENYFQVERMKINTVIEVGSMEATKELVKLDLGISILAPWVAANELKEKTLLALPLGRRKLKRTWGILVRHGRTLNLAEELFVAQCKSATSRLLGAL